jgi:hypothetical protein
MHQRLYRPSLIIKVKQEIKQKIEDGLKEKQVKKVLSDVKSKAESYMFNNTIIS